MDWISNMLGFVPVAAFDTFAKGAAQMAFFKVIFEFLDNEIAVFRDDMLGKSLSWVTAVAFVLMALWIFIQGYRIATGRSRESMMLLVMNSMRSLFIVTVAASMALGTSDLYEMFTDKTPREINYLVTGEYTNPTESIDRSLDFMQVAMVGIDAIADENPNNKDDKDRALWLTGIGVAGPSVVGGAILLLYKIALALFVGLAPIFILSLLFEQTKQLFSRWLYYGIGTMFSLAVMSFMTSVAFKMVGAVAAAFAAQYVVAMNSGGAPAEGISSMAMQQGGLGLILTLLLVTVPPMAAQFFQGTMGSFSAYSQFGVTGRPPSDYGRPPQLGGYVQPSTNSEAARSPARNGERPDALSIRAWPSGAPSLASAERDTIRKTRSPE
jgi:type IV secretion system protein VirB6